jgi:2-dehydro-3-deoxygluconokinase
VGGDALNTAVGMARLGSQVSLFTRLGKDVFSDEIRQVLGEEGVDFRAVRTVNTAQAGVYFVAVGDAGQREFVYYRSGSAASTMSPEDIRPNLLNGVQTLYSSGVTLALSTSARKTVSHLFQAARKKGITTVLDPNFRRALWDNTDAALDALNEILPFVDVLLPTVPDDTMPVMGMDHPERVIEYFWLKGVPLVVVKAGASGAYVGYKKQIERIPAIEANPLDATGAGDAFNAGFMTALGQRQPLLDCARLGNVVAGLKIQRRGAIAGLPTKEAALKKLLALSPEAATGTSKLQGGAV